MRTKIAPMLSWHFNQTVFASDRAALREDAPKMRAELRALLAVARAARQMCRYSIPPREWRSPGEDARRTAFRAVERLDRLGRKS